MSGQSSLILCQIDEGLSIRSFHELPFPEIGTKLILLKLPKDEPPERQNPLEVSFISVPDLHLTFLLEWLGHPPADLLH